MIIINALIFIALCLIYNRLGLLIEMVRGDVPEDRCSKGGKHEPQRDAEGKPQISIKDGVVSFICRKCTIIVNL